MTTFVSRPEWGSANTSPAFFPGALPELYIHHTGAPSPAPTPAAEALHMRQLQSYAIRPVSQGGKGYSDLDYNLVVGRSGRIYEGRGIDRKSAATLDRNNVSRSICVMGNYQTEALTDAIAAAVIEGSRLMIAAGQLDPAAIVRGHRDNPAHPGATACPGNNLYAAIPVIAASIASPTGATEMQAHLITINGAAAQYRAYLDPAGEVLIAEWTGPGGNAKTNQMLQRCAHLPRKAVELAELSGATLLGPLPTGDPGHAWNGAEFFRVVP